MVKSVGQVLVERVEAFIGRYVAMPPESEGQGLVLALWAIHTWLYEHFPATPYLMITASTKQAGKTLLMDVLGCICRGSHSAATLRPLALLRVIKESEGRCTLFIDEAEKLSSAAVGDTRSIFTSGYRVGGSHTITAKLEGFIKFSTYCPKAFALIGDVMDVVRDRAIPIRLRRMAPALDFYPGRDTAEADAAKLILALRQYFQETPALVQPGFMKGREAEIWTPLFSVAAALKVDGATMERLVMAAADMSASKTAEARAFFDSQAEIDTTDDSAAERALMDLASVMPERTREATGDLFSVEAVARMRAIPSGPWRTFKGKGLDANMLAGLVKRFGVSPRTVKMSRGARGQKALSGYSRVDVMASVPTVGKGKAS